jgi:hypothetical protein
MYTPPQQPQHRRLPGTPGTKCTMYTKYTEKPLLLSCQRSDSLAALGGWTADLRKIGCIALLAHFEVACQAKQGAVVDVVWNQ